MTRRHDVRRVNTRRSYRTNEIAELLNVTKITVYQWINDGLAPIDDAKPYLIHGSTLTKFLVARNKPREPLQCGQIYCVACKRPCAPRGGVVEWVKRSAAMGDIVGTCPWCGRKVFRRVSSVRLSSDLGHLMITNEDAADTMIGSAGPLRTITSAGGR